MVALEKLESAYRGRRVLVTGHTGFKGTWLVLILNKLGAEVLGYALQPESGHMYELIGGDNYCQSVIGDIRNREKFQNEIEKFSPELVFHLAAQSLVLEAHKTPLETFEVNVIGTANLLEIVRQSNNTCSVVVVTTDKVYVNDESRTSFSESDRLGGNDIYSGSKAAAEIVLSSYKNSFFKHHQQKFVSVRAGNVIGGGDFSENRLIPDIIKAYKSDRKMTIRNPQAVRPWQHVLESLSGYLMLGMSLIENKPVSDSYNFGPNDQSGVSVEEILKVCSTNLEYPLEVDFKHSDVKESGFLQIDSSLAAKELKWVPKWNIEETIKNTLDWYLTQEDKLVQKTLSQVEDYFG